MKKTFLMILIAASFAACKSDAPKQADAANTATPTATEVKADTLQHVHVYTCPMHPEVKSDKEGDKCPKCGMALEHKD
jgi:hypothetical protein